MPEMFSRLVDMLICFFPSPLYSVSSLVVIIISQNSSKSIVPLPSSSISAMMPSRSSSVRLGSTSATMDRNWAIVMKPWSREGFCWAVGGLEVDTPRTESVSLRWHSAVWRVCLDSIISYLKLLPVEKLTRPGLFNIWLESQLRAVGATEKNEINEAKNLIINCMRLVRLTSALRPEISYCQYWRRTKSLSTFFLLFDDIWIDPKTSNFN